MDSHRNTHFRNFINCHCLLQVWLGYSSCPAQSLGLHALAAAPRTCAGPILETGADTPPLLFLRPGCQHPCDLFLVPIPLTQVRTAAHQALTELVQRTVAAPATVAETAFASAPVPSTPVRLQLLGQIHSPQSYQLLAPQTYSTHLHGIMGFHGMKCFPRHIIFLFPSVKSFTDSR